MRKKQDIMWEQSTLWESVEKWATNYLKKNHSEYRELQVKAMRIVDENPALRILINNMEGNLRAIRNLLSGGENTLQQQTALWQESQLLEEQIQALIMQNARIAMDQEKYQQEFDELVERHRQVKQEYEEQALASEQDIGRVAQIDYFINTLEEMDAPVTEFDDQLWISMVDHVVVHSKDDIRVIYRDGIEK